MNENPETEVTPIQEVPVDSENTGTPEIGTEKPIQEQKDYSDQLQQILDSMNKGEELNTLVELPNGSSFMLVSKVTVGEVLVASAIFLLLSFQVLKWLLNHVWRR